VSVGELRTQSDGIGNLNRYLSLAGRLLRFHN
jgi:hypothetical protein